MSSEDSQDEEHPPTFLEVSAKYLRRLGRLEELRREIRTLETDYPILRGVRGLVMEKIVKPGESSGTGRKPRKRKKGSDSLSSEERAKRDRIWKLKAKVNTLRMKRKAGRIPPVKLVKEILLGEKSEDISLITDGERADISTARILEEISPALKGPPAPRVRPPKRRAEVSLKSPPKKSRK